jgi:hypothetical protein
MANIWSASMRALEGGQSRWHINVTRCTLIGYRPALHARLATINRWQQLLVVVFSI